jgi:hypothetical protein
LLSPRYYRIRNWIYRRSATQIFVYDQLLLLLLIIYIIIIIIIMFLINIFTSKINSFNHGYCWYSCAYKTNKRFFYFYRQQCSEKQSFS